MFHAVAQTSELDQVTRARAGIPGARWHPAPRGPLWTVHPKVFEPEDAGLRTRLSAKLANRQAQCYQPIVIAGAPPEAEAAERGFRAELLIMTVNQKQLADIAALVASGDVRVEIAGTFPLDDVAKAHELSEAGHTRGKLMLIP